MSPFEDVELRSTDVGGASATSPAGADPPLYQTPAPDPTQDLEIIADPQPEATDGGAGQVVKQAAMGSAVTLTRTASRPSGRGLRSRPSLPEPPSAAGSRSRVSLSEPPPADPTPRPSISGESRRSQDNANSRGFQLQRRPSGASNAAPNTGAGAGIDAGAAGLVARLRGVVMASLEDLETLEGGEMEGSYDEHGRTSLEAGRPLPLSRARSLDWRAGARWGSHHQMGGASTGGGAFDLLAKYGAYSQSNTSMLGMRAFDRASWHGPEVAGGFPDDDGDDDDEDGDSATIGCRGAWGGRGAVSDEGGEAQRIAEKKSEKRKRRVMGLVIGGAPPLPSRSASLPDHTKHEAGVAGEIGAEGEKVGTSEGTVESLPPPAPEVETPKRGFFYAVWTTTTPMERALILVACVAACISGLTRPLTSLVLGSFTNAFTAYGAVQTDDTRAQLLHRGNVLALDVVYIGIGAFVTSALWTIIFESIANRVAYRLRALVFSAALDQELAFHEKRSAAEVLSVVSADVQLVKDALGEKTGALLLYLGTFLSGFAVALVKSWRLGLLLGCTVLPTILIAGFLVQRQSAKFARKAFAVYAAASSLTDEVISSIRTVYAFNAQKQLADKYEGKLEKSLGYATRKALFQGALIGSAVFIIFSAYSLCFYYGTTLLLDGDATPGAVVSVFFAILVSCLGLTSAAPILEAFARASAGCARIYRIIERESLLDRSGDYTNSELAGRIDLNAVEFAYPSRPTTVLKRVSMTIEAGQKTALVGGSGSGKSTIIQLLLRFYQPGRGEITLDGTPLDRYDLDWLRMNIGYVPQDPELFSISVLDNVAMGLPPLLAAELQPAEVQELVVAACKKAQIHEAIMKLPEGYFTFIGERGGQFSGGQRARLSIARAIISDPPILLFDEPTSALDAINESMVQETLDRVCAGKTTVTVAHRLSTIRNSDKIIVMKDGVPIEEGNHAQLMAAQGEYSRLVAAQQLAKAAEAAGQVAQSMIPEESIIAASTSGPSSDWQSLADRRGSMTSSRKLLMPVEHHPEKSQKRSKRLSAGPSIWSLFRRISQLAQGLRRLFLFSFCCTLLSGCLYPVLAIVLGLTVEGYEKSLLSGEAAALRGDGNQYSLYFFVLAIVGLFSLTAEWFGFGVMSQQLAVRIRATAFRSILQLPISYFDEEANSTAALVTFINSTAQSITNLTGTTFGAILESAVTLIVGAAVALVYGWKLAVVTVSTIPFVLVLGFVRVLIVARRERLSREPATEALVIVGETLTGIRITAAFPLVEETMRKAFNDKLAEPYRYAAKYARAEALSYGVTQMCLIWIIALTFWYGSRLIAQGFFTTGGFYTVFVSVIFGAMHAGTMLVHAGDISKGRSSAAQLVDLMDKADKERSLVLPALKAPIHGDIRARGVNFAYPGRPDSKVLQSLNLVIHAGQYIAFVGESGSGKSTITQLLYRFYDVSSGAIMIDDTKISSWDVASYRSHMAYVPQMPTLYDGTIRWNIELGLQGKTCTEAEMEEVCKDAGLNSFISSLPEGLDTPLGQKGLALSGGQRQRIAIARAIISKPRILILDEATAALDSNSERAVQSALDKAAEGRTTIAIAHRLATVQKADQIFVLAGGKIVDQGTHDQLMRKKGSYYASLAARQSLE